MLELSQIRADLDASTTEASCLSVCRTAAKRLLKLSDADIARIELHRKSVDARKKHDVHFVLSARIELAEHLDEQSILSRVPADRRKNIRTVDAAAPAFPAPVAPSRTSGVQPVVVGAGCAGLFAALTLAHAGLKPLLIERGDDAIRRTESIERFVRTRTLDPESNIQFGLGGAGTFSDGKLNTGTKNPAHRLILQTMVDAGAPREILWDAKPHVGSDILPAVVTHIVDDIRAHGGEVRFRCRMVDIERAVDGSPRALTVEQNGKTERIATSQVILACGHSARDVFELLRRRGFALERKTFAMGVRIEHLQADIDRVQYGRAAGHPALGAAPYKLVAHLPNDRNVFTFCMCPGGEVVAAASEPGGVVVNGASLYARSERNANAALLVNVNPADLPGTDPLAGIELQRSCERRAFELGGGDYHAPAQLVEDFLAARTSTTGGRVEPTYPLGVTWTSLDEVLPAHIVDTLRAGIPALGRRLRGYDAPDAVLTGVETRSSSPVTVVRDRTCVAIGAPGLYPCGEGAGYAGGIMSAATDGIRCAEALLAHVK
ncbi:NAD(P)/FAD-dependent oxidoreductase [Collinsella tanakaei]|uniref:NAD(P)/FAD-dependent oxidoreductase n=1 Tax=Collinsella tanakaei TaxID=626935 RepID=UPI0025A349D0|nr:FAD-binding protein [Collinsella tanakaei]MDM8302905.1 FAD-binding protein [Collinsella tanakaei]